MSAEPLQFDHDDDLDGAVASLSQGDRVLIDNRTIPLEVFDTDSEVIGSDTHETKTVYLEGRAGRVYRLLGEYGHNAELAHGDPTPPRLEIRQEGNWDTVNSAVSRIEVEGGQQILSDTRAADWLEEVGIDVE